jgi:hypothetical protein
MVVHGAVVRASRDTNLNKFTFNKLSWPAPDPGQKKLAWPAPDPGQKKPRAREGARFSNER